MSEEKQGVDMSSEAIWQRLRDVAQLNRLGRVLLKGKLIGTVKEVREKEAREKEVREKEAREKEAREVRLVGGEEAL
jgi:hypothetical protein